MQNEITTTVHQELASIVATEFDTGLAFTGKPSTQGSKVKGFLQPCSFTPAPEPNYIFHETMRELVFWFQENPEPLYICGPTGAGKSSLIRQLAMRLNYPVFEITGHGRLEFADLVGHLSVRDGTMHMQYGPLALAMKYGGIFLLNEMDVVDPATQSGLNTVLDGQPLCVVENEGELIHPHPMFRYVATGNSNGSSDLTGLYQGVVQQNLAHMDRYFVVEVGYPKAEAETTLLTNMFPALDKSLITCMVQMANEVRKAFLNEGIGPSMPVTFSTRTLIRMAKYTLAFQPLAKKGVSPLLRALDCSLGFRTTPEARTALHEVAQRVFPASLGESRGA